MRKPRFPAPALRILALGAALTVGACHRGPQGPGAAAPAPAAKPAAPAGPTVAEQTAGMVEAPGLTKAASGARMKFSLDARPAVGQPLVVELALLPSTFAESATVGVDPSDGVSVDPAEREYSVSALEPNKIYRHSLRVTPTAPGVTDLGLTVTLRHDGVSDALKFSVPLIVADSTPASAAPATPAAPAAPQQK